jgi:hypothetical protein
MTVLDKGTMAVVGKNLALEIRPITVGLLDHREDFSLGANSHAGCPERSAKSVRSRDRTAWVEKIGK